MLEEERNPGEVTIIHIDNRYSSSATPFKVDMDVKFLGSTLESIEYSTPSGSDGFYSLKIGLEDFIISINPKELKPIYKEMNFNRVLLELEKES